MPEVESKTKLGCTVDGYIIDTLLGEGPYSWVYAGMHNTDRSIGAFKFAKPMALSGTAPESVGGSTRALMFTTGGVGEVHPDPSELLALQTQKLQDTHDPSLVAVNPLVIKGGECYVKMVYIGGQTLAEMSQRGPVPLSVLVDLTKSIDRLSHNPNFNYHGDLKPQNIMVDAHARIRLIDPGYFGPMDCREGRFDECIVTTPAYYPLLTPDDLLALGLLLWEIACKIHPLDGSRSLNKMDLSKVDEDLVRWVTTRQNVGQHFLVPLLQTERPSQVRPTLPPEVDDVLLKSIRLRITSSNKLHRDPGFENFSALAEALNGLIQLGITEF
jgi:serine/threonine protein kinase